MNNAKPASTLTAYRTKYINRTTETDREKLLGIVREYSDGDGQKFNEAMSEMYRNLSFKLCTDLKLEAKKKKIRTLDYIESQGLMRDAISIVRELYEGDREQNNRAR